MAEIKYYSKCACSAALLTRAVLAAGQAGGGVHEAVRAADGVQARAAAAVRAAAGAGAGVELRPAVQQRDQAQGHVQQLGDSN